MSKYIANLTVRKLLDSWVSAGLVLHSDSAHLERFILSQQQEKELTLYLRILIGIGAFIASLCFIAFLDIARIITFHTRGNFIFVGLIFIGLALFLVKRSGNEENTVKHSFLTQTSFCAMSIGKTLFVVGLDFHSDLGVPVSTLLITVATYHVYRMSIDRFLSTLVFFISLLNNLLTKQYFNISPEIMLNLFFFIQVLLAAILLIHGRVKMDYIPIAYAVVFSLSLTTIYFTIDFKIGYWNKGQTYSLTFVNILLTLSLIGLIGWVSGNLNKLQTEPLMLAFIGTVLLGFISAPGVILAICLMVLGYAKHEKLLLLMGLLLIPVFIFLYYYNLDISLMAKSGTLIGSGIVLLVSRGYLAAKKLDRRV